MIEFFRKASLWCLFVGVPSGGLPLLALYALPDQKADAALILVLLVPAAVAVLVVGAACAAVVCVAELVDCVKRKRPS